jgi:hypothetical protein
LLSGKLSDHFYSYGFSSARSDTILDPAVDPRLFELAAGTLHVPGEQLGSLITRSPYADYTLTLEFKWGDKTYPPRKDKPRAAMILLHAQGPEGFFAKNWMPSVACLLTEGDTGSLRLMGEPDAIKGQANAVEKPGPRPGTRRYYYDPKAPPVQVASAGPRGGQGLIHRAGFPTALNPAEEKTGFHPPGDLANKPGDWNTLEIACAGGNINVLVNGKEACALTGLNVQGGKIALTSEHAEYTVRKFVLTRLGAR